MRCLPEAAARVLRIEDVGAQADGIDDEHLAFPVTYRMAEPGRLRFLRGRSSVEIDQARVNPLFVVDPEVLAFALDLDRQGVHDLARKTVRLAVQSGIGGVGDRVAKLAAGGDQR